MGVVVVERQARPPIRDAYCLFCLRRADNILPLRPWQHPCSLDPPRPCDCGFHCCVAVSIAFLYFSLSLLVISEAFLYVLIFSFLYLAPLLKRRAALPSPGRGGFIPSKSSSRLAGGLPLRYHSPVVYRRHAEHLRLDSRTRP